MMKILEYVRDSKKVLYTLGMKGKLGFIKDEPYLRLMYWANTGKKLNLDNPKTYNEKLQWLKLHDHNPEYSKMVDKYEAKKYVASIIGDEYIIPTLGVWDKFDDIDFSALPDQFVLKCTHDSGGLVICRDKSTFNYEEAKRKINNSLKRNYYVVGREYPYKNVRPRIIAEKYMEDSVTKELRDYKFYTMQGIAEALMIVSDRQKGKGCADYFDMDFKHLDFTWGYPNSEIDISKPATFNKMREIAEKIASGTNELRVDFYEVDGKSYFGEITFFEGSGFQRFEPDEWDEKFGKMLEIPSEIGGGYAVVSDGFVLHISFDERCLTDYKFFCFDGEPKICYVSKDKSESPATDFFDMSFSNLPIRMRDNNSNNLPQKPDEFDEMVKIAKLLSKSIKHIRIDFYDINHHIYVGELTFYHNSGFSLVQPEEWNIKMGEWIAF